MREIKFRVWLHRGWPGKEHEMAEVDYYFFEEWGYRTSEEVESAGHKLMQYTGLKDKNGKEIYEGDLIYARSSAVPEVVVWDNNRAGWDPLLAPNDGAREPGDSPSEFEVIGNLYEHPNLLKPVKQ